MRHTGSVSDTRIVCVPAILSVLSLTKEIWIFPILEILVFGDFFTGRITRKPVSKTGRRIEKGCGSRPKAQSSVGPWGTEIVWFPRGIPRWLRLITTWSQEETTLVESQKTDSSPHLNNSKMILSINESTDFVF